MPTYNTIYVYPHLKKCFKNHFTILDNSYLLNSPYITELGVRGFILIYVLTIF